MAKIQPAQTEFIVSVPHGTAVNVDIAHCLSIVNRRLYRQGMMYYIEEVQAVGPAGMVGGISAIPDTWVVHNAWKKGFKTWQTMQNEYADGVGSAMKGKWADFKVDIDDAGLNFLTPVDGNGDAYLTGEWIYSNFVYDDNGSTQSPSIHMIGSSNDDSAIGLIEAYGDARNYPQATPANPSEMTTGFYAQFHGVGDIDDELGTDIRDDNDLPPYDIDDYPGGAANGDYVTPVQYFAATSDFAMVRTGGFKAPCGLIEISQAQTSGTNAALFLIKVATGPYKGVMAEPMGQ